MKTLSIILLVGIASCSFLSAKLKDVTPKEKIQLSLNGLFEANALPDPTTIVPCFTDGSALEVTDFTGSILQKACAGNVLALEGEITTFVNNLDAKYPDLGKCLDGNAELVALGAKFGITPDVDTTKLKNHVISYVTLHLLGVRNSLCKISKQWNDNNNYYQAGVDGSSLGHDILDGFKNKINKSQKLMAGNFGASNIDIIQLFLNGLFEANGLPDPTTITPCIDDQSAAKIVEFIPQLFKAVGKASVFNYNKVIDLVKNFGDSLNPAVGECLKDNAELEALGNKFCISANGDNSAVQKKAETYVATHFLGVQSSCRNIENEWNKGNYYEAGKLASKLGHEVVGSCNKFIRKD